VGSKVPRGYIAVPTVVARSREYERRERTGKTVDCFGERGPCPLHQRLDRCAGGNRGLLSRAHSFDGEDGAAVGHGRAV
jgi:hypothetical protein